MFIEGEAKQSKVKPIVMKWWSKRISSIKAAKMSEAAFETQAAFVACGVGEEAMAWKINQ